MELDTGKHISFPIVVWYAAETGEIQVCRPTDRGFRVKVSRDPGSATGHPQLYRALSHAIRDHEAGFAEPPAKFS